MSTSKTSEGRQGCLPKGDSSHTSFNVWRLVIPFDVGEDLIEAIDSEYCICLFFFKLQHVPDRWTLRNLLVFQYLASSLQFIFLFLGRLDILFQGPDVKKKGGSITKFWKTLSYVVLVFLVLIQNIRRNCFLKEKAMFRTCYASLSSTFWRSRFSIRCAWISGGVRFDRTFSSATTFACISAFLLMANTLHLYNGNHTL